MNRLASENVAVVGNVDPDAYGAGTYTTGWIAAKNFEHFLAIVQVGTLGASATVDAKLQQASDASGTGAKDITGKAITQLTQAGTDDDKQVLINLRPSEMDMDNNFSHFRLSITVATAASDAGGIVLGVDPLFAPANNADAATVDEIVS